MEIEQGNNLLVRLKSTFGQASKLVNFNFIFARLFDYFL